MSCELLAASKGGNIYIFMEMQDAGSVCETELRPPCVVHVVHMQADQKFAPQTAFRSAQLQKLELSSAERGALLAVRLPGLCFAPVALPLLPPPVQLSHCL